MISFSFHFSLRKKEKYSKSKVVWRTGGCPGGQTENGGGLCFSTSSWGCSLSCSPSQTCPSFLRTFFRLFSSFVLLWFLFHYFVFASPFYISSRWISFHILSPAPVISLEKFQVPRFIMYYSCLYVCLFYKVYNMHCIEMLKGKVLLRVLWQIWCPWAVWWQRPADWWAGSAIWLDKNLWSV